MGNRPGGLSPAGGPIDRRILLVIFALGLGAVAVWFVAPDTDIEAPTLEDVERAEVIERIDRESAAHDHGDHGTAHGAEEEPEDAEQRGNPDRPIVGPGRDRVERQPPLNDAEEWRQRRMDEARLLHEGQVAAARGWCEAQSLDDEVTGAVVAAVDELHQQVRELKRQVESGTIPPAELRAQTPRLRQQTRESLSEVLGPREIDALNRTLTDAALGGGF